MKPYIITIARQYGSGGKTVGKMLANKLQIPFYGREIIAMASEDSGINPVLFSDEQLKPDVYKRQLHALLQVDAPCYAGLAGAGTGSGRTAEGIGGERREHGCVGL